VHEVQFKSVENLIFKLELDISMEGCSKVELPNEIKADVLVVLHSSFSRLFDFDK